MTRSLLLPPLLFWLAAAAAAPEIDRVARPFNVAAPAEVSAIVVAGCAGCDWSVDGREAAALRVSVDGKYSQHIVLARGEAPVEYTVSLGSLTAGRHALTIERDPALSARDAGAAAIELPKIGTLFEGRSDDYVAQSMSPILYARPNTIGRFTDLPLLMWYEVVPTPRGRQYRYSVIFSNEDGGTATDRLMATWGRTTDIEFVYGVEIDEAGRILAEAFQGPGHEVPAFKGRHEARHPLLWVSTDNNMVSESGPTDVRYALVPIRFDLTDMSREAVMDANPWLYVVMGRELVHEHKIAESAPGNGTIPDPRRFVYVEACGQVGNAALAFAVGVRSPRAGGDRAAPLDWIPSDRGVRQYRIVRDGCFRAATPLPAGVAKGDVRALRVLAFDRPPAADRPQAPTTPVHLTRINKLFMLDDGFLPTPSLLQWLGSASIAPNGAPFELAIP